MPFFCLSEEYHILMFFVNPENGYVLGYKIPELVKDEKIKARKLSYGSQMYLLMLGQFLHVFSLNELVDVSKIYATEHSRPYWRSCRLCS